MVAVLSNQVGPTRPKQICISNFDDTRYGPLMPAAIHSTVAFVEVNIREIERLAFCYSICCRYSDPLRRLNGPVLQNLQSAAIPCIKKSEGNRSGSLSSRKEDNFQPGQICPEKSSSHRIARR